MSMVPRELGLDVQPNNFSLMASGVDSRLKGAFLLRMPGHVVQGIAHCRAWNQILDHVSHSGLERIRSCMKSITTPFLESDWPETVKAELHEGYIGA